MSVSSSARCTFLTVTYDEYMMLVETQKQLGRIAVIFNQLVKSGVHEHKPLE